MHFLKKLFTLLLALFLILLPCLLLIDHAMPIFGYSFHVVQTGSMEPEIHVDDVAIVRQCKPEDIRVDDIIAYLAPNYYPPITLTHRVRQVITELDGEQGFWVVAYGDSQSDIRPEHHQPISAQNIIGKVAGSIPRLSRAVAFMRSSQGTLITLLCCWLSALVIVLPVVRKRRGRKRS